MGKEKKVLPARAGMALVLTRPLAPTPTFSPHALGWPDAALCREVWEHVLPARAGMARVTRQRRCGGAQVLPARAGMARPAPFAGFGLEQVHPARAGMAR